MGGFIIIYVWLTKVRMVLTWVRGSGAQGDERDGQVGRDKQPCLWARFCLLGRLSSFSWLVDGLARFMATERGLFNK